MTVNTELPRPIPTSRIGIIYGYLVCLIALGIALVGLNTIVSRVVDLSFADVGIGDNLQNDMPKSFRDYKQQVLQQRANRVRDLHEMFPQKDVDSNVTTHTRNAALQALLQDVLRVPTDEELRSEYTEILARDQAREPGLKRNAIDKKRYRIARNLLSALQLFFTGAILFILHWRWVQRRIERVALAPLLQEIV